MRTVSTVREYKSSMAGGMRNEIKTSSFSGRALSISMALTRCTMGPKKSFNLVDCSSMSFLSLGVASGFRPSSMGFLYSFRKTFSSGKKSGHTCTTSPRLSAPQYTRTCALIVPSVASEWSLTQTNGGTEMSPDQNKPRREMISTQ